MNEKKIYDSLKELNFTEYEAKVYVSLVQSSPANGNAIAKHAAIPPSKVYETLRKMEEQELVITISADGMQNKKQYAPVPYDLLLKRERKAFTENVTFLEKALHDVAAKNDTGWTELFVIHGYNASVDAIQSALENAKTEVLMNCWSTELALLMGDLAEANERGVLIKTLTFDLPAFDIPWENHIHQPMEASLKRHRGELCLVIDNKKSIVFQALDPDDAEAVISEHPSSVLTTSNYIRHDIMLNDLAKQVEEESTKQLTEMKQ